MSLKPEAIFSPPFFLFKCTKKLDESCPCFQIDTLRKSTGHRGLFKTTWVFHGEAFRHDLGITTTYWHGETHLSYPVYQFQKNNHTLCPCPYSSKKVKWQIPKMFCCFTNRMWDIYALAHGLLEGKSSLSTDTSDTSMMRWTQRQLRIFQNMELSSPETNISENGWLEDDCLLLGWLPGRCYYVSFREG